MLHRITVMFIIGFWVAMTGLLVLREIYPDATRLNTIPVAHVGRVLFQHEHSSDLAIRDKTKEVGYVHLQPRTNAETGERKLEFHGNIGLAVLGVGKQRISWKGDVVFDKAFGVAALSLTISTYEPAQQLKLELDPATNVAKYEISIQGTKLEGGSFTMDNKGVASLLERAGIPAGLFQQLIAKQSAMPEPEFSARQSTLTMSGETISTFVVTATVGGQTLLEGHITQLGQILKAQAPALGYKLLPHNSKDTE